MKFTKLPVTIEAIQFDGRNALEICVFTNQKSYPTDASLGHSDWNKKQLIIPTFEGQHVASCGDWIIKGVKGEFYPCKPDIFALTYVAESPTPSQQLQQAAEELAPILYLDIGIVDAVEFHKRATKAINSNATLIAMQRERDEVINKWTDLAVRNHHMREQNAQHVETIHLLKSRLSELENTPSEFPDGKWIDKWGSCRVCGGEIPDGHTNDCDLWKMEQKISELEEHQDPNLHTCAGKACKNKYCQMRQRVEELERARDRLIDKINLNGISQRAAGALAKEQEV